MRKLILGIALIFALASPAYGASFTAPEAPESAQGLISAEKETFAEGLWYVIKSAVGQLEPKFAKACKVCFSLFAVVLLLSVMENFLKDRPGLLHLLSGLAIGGLLLAQSNVLIQLSVDTVQELSEYGKLLIPVMCAAMAAQGGAVTSGAIYGGTVLFNGLLSSGIAKLLIPLVYAFLALAVANCMNLSESLGKMKDTVKWLISWFLKIVLYVVTGYLSITGIISGTTDAVALKATRLTISGMVPVVGGVLSDASEAVLVGAGVVKNAVGVYGVIALVAIWIAPFLEVGVQYLLLKLTGILCDIFGVKSASGLIQDFATAMGLLLAMTATVCCLLLFSTVCFMRGVG